jgi:hypothetical protein
MAGIVSEIREMLGARSTDFDKRGKRTAIQRK